MGRGVEVINYCPLRPKHFSLPHRVVGLDEWLGDNHGERWAILFKSRTWWWTWPGLGDENDSNRQLEDIRIIPQVRELPQWA